MDWVGPYTVTDQKGNDRNLNAMVFIGLATSWFDITKITDKTTTSIS